MKKSILVIDDDDQFRLMLRRLLEKEGYEIFEATNGKEGIKEFRRLRTDIVITDIIMPEVEGVETILCLRKEFPDVKIAAISGGGRSAPEGYLVVAKKLGAEFVMEKPIDRKLFLDELKRLASK